MNAWCIQEPCTELESLIRSFLRWSSTLDQSGQIRIYQYLGWFTQDNTLATLSWADLPLISA